MSVTDSDSGTNSQLSYSLLRSFPLDHVFQINSSTGVISTRLLINRDITPTFLLNVRATDEGTPPLHSEINITVEVLDQNTHPPSIHNLPAVLNVSEATSAGVQIFRVNATDDDLGENAKLRYHLIGNV